MLLVNSPVGPVRLQQRRLPRSRVHPNRPSMTQALTRQDQLRAGALRHQAPESRRNLSQWGPRMHKCPKDVCRSTKFP